MLGWSKKCDGQEQRDAITGLSRLVEELPINANDPMQVVPVKNVIFDTGNFFTGDGKLHISQNGTYLVIGQITYNYEKTAMGSRWAIIRKNGDEQIARSNTSPNNSTGGPAATASVITQLEKGDYLELVADIGVGVDGGAPSTRTTFFPEGTQISIVKLG